MERPCRDGGRLFGLVGCHRTDYLAAAQTQGRVRAAARGRPAPSPGRRTTRPSCSTRTRWAKTTRTTMRRVTGRDARAAAVCTARDRRACQAGASSSVWKRLSKARSPARASARLAAWPDGPAPDQPRTTPQPALADARLNWSPSRQRHTPPKRSRKPSHSRSIHRQTVPAVAPRPVPATGRRQQRQGAEAPGRIKPFQNDAHLGRTNGARPTHAAGEPRRQVIDRPHQRSPPTAASS